MRKLSHPIAMFVLAVLVVIGGGVGVLAATTTTAPASPSLYVSTGMMPGSLFAWPSFPARIWYDNHDFMAQLRWTRASPASASGVGTFHVDMCNPDCAAGSYHSYGTVLTASRPKSCAVHLYNVSTGVERTTQAYVYVMLKAQITSGSKPPLVPSFPLACS
jgi:hypothetical protein